MRCLALDVGERRIGVAVGEVLARPLATLHRRSKASDLSRIAALIREQQAEALVVGLPLNMDGSQGFQAQRVIRYAQRLHQALRDMGVHVALAFWDERLTTEDAGQLLSEDWRRESERYERIDAVAAAVILQSYLDQCPRDGG